MRKVAFVFSATAILGVIIAVILWMTLFSGTPPAINSDHGNDLGNFVGRQSCQECHSDVVGLWHDSHHDLAMQPASETTVLGDFDNATFTYYGVRSTFFRRDSDYFVQTDSPDGTIGEYKIAYTFGIEPLQQYLIEFPGGRFQALNVCWDTRPAADGGQRWFHLYPDDEITHDDVLHWTGPFQNWNYMCAECHSTNLQKNYRLETGHFETSWSEIDVSCEACHGPGSRHIEWAKTFEPRNPSDQEYQKGFVFSLVDKSGATWIFDSENPTARLSRSRESAIQIETCGRCHSRRTAITDKYRYGKPLADTHRIALLDEGIYYADGQILEEVYVYGSFLQTKMYREGVTCTDCHDPHTTRLRREGNAICTSCHQPEKFDSPEHHHHPANTPGADCVECHMPSKNYMVVDPRRDHSFRVPRPDLSVKIGTPNACVNCHDDRTPEWATETVRRWYGPKRSDQFHFGEAIHAGRNWLSGAESMLERVANDSSNTGIVKATALSLLARYLGEGSMETLERGLKASDPLVRIGALRALEAVEPVRRVPLGYPLLLDPIRTVRMEAARILAPVPSERMAPEQRMALEQVLEEYGRAQIFNADRAESYLNLGWLHTQRGEYRKAEEAYQKAVKMRPSFVAPYVNLADLYRMEGRENEGEEILRKALDIEPDDGDAHHALGLHLVRRKRLDEAIEELERGADLRPDEPFYSYVLGVALNSTGEIDRSLKVLKEAHVNHPGSRDLLFALATISRDSGDLNAAVGWAKKLVDLSPRDSNLKRLLAELEKLRQPD